MFVRSTEMHADPAMVDDGIAIIRDDIFPAVSELDGNVGLSLLGNRNTGRSIVATAWQSEDAMRRSADKVVPMRDRAEQTLLAGTSHVHHWEVAAVHRDHATPEGACARLIWLSDGDPATTDRVIDTYRLAVVPRLEDMDGFCSTSLMIEPQTGRAVGTTAFDSRAAMEASRGATQRIRERAAIEMGVTIDAVEEMEVLFAHLHVPEMR